jgi:hypothetical protein
MNLEVREEKLVEEQDRGLLPFDGQDLLAELEEFRTRVAGVEYEHATEAGKLSMLVVGISNALVDLRTLPIWDILQLSKIDYEVLAMTGLILESLWEEHASGIGPWD